MPSKHIVKDYAPDSYYHIYSRGVEKRQIFLDEKDFAVFLNMLKRYLSPVSAFDLSRREYPNFADEIELTAYCLMQNHFHLLVYQRSERAVTDFMRSLLTSYTMYFNRRHKRVGSLFQSRYHASRIDSDSYLLHISRYIHLNPMDYQNYPYTSFGYYMGLRSAEWVKPERILELHKDARAYADFVADYTDYKKMLDGIKHQLADSGRS